MRHAPTPTETLRICYEFSENELSVAAQDPLLDTPGAAMETMNHAQNLRNRPHAVFSQKLA